METKIRKLSCLCLVATAILGSQLALEAGAAAYLVKTNYRLEEVLEKVKNLLQK